MDNGEKRPGLSQDIIAGRNPVLEALRSGRPIDHVLVAKGSEGGSMVRILALCREKGVVVKQAARAKLDGLCGSLNHQGIAAVAAARAYVELTDLLELARKRNEPPLIIVCDEINDPHNLGAIIRTAEAVGAHGVVVPRRGGAGLTTTVDKAAAGALEYLPVARVPNLAAAVDTLKENGLWVYGADMSGKPVFGTAIDGPAAVVVGSEGAGISRLLREKCDFLISLPMRGRVGSLNASVACGVLLYELLRARLAKEGGIHEG